jgi:sulfur-carrier protein adenylyltransferase/sulfurtransferase
MHRYARHLALPEIGPEGQARLGGARVLVVGAGGLGSPAALYLAAAGVGTLGIVDPDRVELSNLQRQVLHATADVGRRKTASAAARLRALNPEIRVEPHPVRLDASNALELLGAHDLVVDGSDNFATRYLVNDAAVRLGIPWVFGAVLRWEGQLALFGAPNGPCYRCLFRDPPPPGAVPGCAAAGVVGALPGIIGSLQALEAVKWIVSAGGQVASPFESAAGRLLVFDAARLRLREICPRKDPACPTCGTAADPYTPLPDYDLLCGDAGPGSPADARTAEGTSGGAGGFSVPEVTPAELRAALDGPDPPLVVDVREGWEWSISNLARDGAVHLPMDRIDDVGAIHGDRQVVLLCRSGGRSLEAAVRLRELGVPRVANLRGGLHAWARDVDPEMPVG